MTNLLKGGLNGEGKSGKLNQAAIGNLCTSGTWTIQETVDASPTIFIARLLDTDPIHFILYLKGHLNVEELKILEVDIKIKIYPVITKM